MELHGIGITVKIEQRPQGLIFSVLKQSHTIFQRRKNGPWCIHLHKCSGFPPSTGNISTDWRFNPFNQRTKRTHKTQLRVSVKSLASALRPRQDRDQRALMIFTHVWVAETCTSNPKNLGHMLSKTVGGQRLTQGMHLSKHTNQRKSPVMFKLFFRLLKTLIGKLHSCRALSDQQPDQWSSTVWNIPSQALAHFHLSSPSSRPSTSSGLSTPTSSFIQAHPGHLSVRERHFSSQEIRELWVTGLG